jgi:hypothetical protein
MSVEYGEIKKIDVDGYTRKIFHVSNLVLNSELEGSSKKVIGNSFLYFINDWQYGHVLQDVIGHYEFLKQFIPDLQLLILSGNEGEYGDESFFTKNSVIDNIIESYPECIFVNENNKILIENIYCLFGLFMYPIRDVIETNEMIHSHEDPDFKYQTWAAKAIVKKFGTKEPVKPTRKIYISRSIADTTYEAKYLSYYKRIRVLENSKLLEDYLESLGYEIILNESLNVEEQAKLYQSASHVVTINGTGAYNTIFCDAGTKIFFLDIHTEFWWFFDYLTSEVTSNTVHMLPRIKSSADNEGHSIVVEQLIACLKEYEHVL